MRRTVILTVLIATTFLLIGCEKEASPEKVIPKSVETAILPEQLMNAKCTICHDETRWKNSNYTPDEWSAIIDRMKDVGADLSDDELKILKHWENK